MPWQRGPTLLQLTPRAIYTRSAVDTATADAATAAVTAGAEGLERAHGARATVDGKGADRQRREQQGGRDGSRNA